ncbi:MAG: CoA transferase [Candidatus Tectomicrobia bacterium]|nr:CoA transferase [Candidatus Tectomicrobia bacterium]
MAENALSDIRVLDVSQGISGPFCTKLLADFGAEVIKIEPPGGENARTQGPFLHDDPHPEKSGLFLHLNRNKQGITLNLTCRSGQKIFRELVKQADVVVENFIPGFMASLGLDYESLEKMKSSLVMTSISYFGQNGPYQQFKGGEIIGYAMGGLMFFTGDKDHPPLKAAGSQAEYQAGLNAAVATLTALHLRDATGIGQQIDLSVMECVVSLLEGATLGFSIFGTERMRDGARHHSACPSTVLPCQDGYVFVHASSDWSDYVRFVEEPGLDDPKYEGPRRQYADEIEEITLPWLMKHKKQEIFHMAQAHHLPFAIAYEIHELLKDPHCQARGFFPEIDHPATGKLIYPGAPFKMSENRWESDRAPLLGEHNREIYCQRLGYSKEDVVKLREMGII